MAFLSNLFGGGDSESSNDFLGILDVSGDFVLNTESESFDRDEDGDETYSFDRNSIDGSLDLTGIANSATDSFSDSDGGGSLLG